MYIRSRIITTGITLFQNYWSWPPFSQISEVAFPPLTWAWECWCFRARALECPVRENRSWMMWLMRGWCLHKKFYSVGLGQDCWSFLYHERQQVDYLALFLSLLSPLLSLRRGRLATTPYTFHLILNAELPIFFLLLFFFMNPVIIQLIWRTFGYETISTQDFAVLYFSGSHFSI